MTLPDRIETLKDLHLATDLTQETVIYVPADAPWKGASERLRGMMPKGSVVGGSEADEAGAWEALGRSHVVVVGNAMNNPVAMALYKSGYAYADDFYPGGDGYALRTIHNPNGVGHNAVLIGAGTAGGAAAGVARLGNLLYERGGTLGYTNQAVSDTHAGLLPDVTPAAFRDQMAAAYRGNALRGPIESGVTMGLTHHLTGDAGCAAMFRDVLFYYECLVHERHGGQWGFEHMLFIYAWTWRLFHVWDLIEESDAFTDDERLRMTNLLWGLTRHVAGLPYFRGVEPGKEVAGSAILRWQPEIRQNHATFAALSMSFSAGYFAAYYGIQGYDEQVAVCKAIFDGQADCYKPNDDGGGGGYCWLVPNHLMTYDFRNGTDRYLSGGHLRELADYAVLITDNLGSLVGFGDVGSYGRRRTCSPGVSAVLTKAAWYYDEGGYLWALRWMGGGPVHAGYYNALPEAEPDWLAGVSVAPFNRPLYEWVERHGPGGANVPQEEAFDKLTIRSGFDENDLYLLLDGTSTFAHGHDDGNSIERLTWKGRMWLAETDYIWRRPRHHSSVVSICDGESREMPSLTALKWAETFGDLSSTRSTVPAYNGVDWTRDLVWLSERFLLVLDTVDLLEDADYDLRCLWRTLGDVRLEDDGLRVEQDGVHFRILNADDSVKSLEAEHPRVPGQDPYAAYDYADGPIRIFKQRVETHGRPGDRLVYANLMAAGTEDAVAGLEARPLADGVFAVRDRQGGCVIGRAGKGFRLGPLSLSAGLFVSRNARLTLIDATRLDVWGAGFSADRPVHADVDLAAGRATLRLRVETGILFNGVPELRVDGRTSGSSSRTELAPGEHEVLFQPQPMSFEYLGGSVTKAEMNERRPKRNRLMRRDDGQGLDVEWYNETGDTVTRLADAGDRVAVGTNNGRVMMVDAAGEVCWQAETGAEIRALHAAAVGGGCLLAGGADCGLTLFGTDGSVVWRRAFDRSHGRDQIVNAVVAADTMGDGVTRVIAATDGWLVWSLDEGGDEVWQRQIEHHAARSLAAGDVDGDGRLEILVGTEYYNSNLLEADGSIRWTIRGGPGFTALALADLARDGALAAIYGSMDGCVYAFDSREGRRLWAANLGDDVPHGFALEVDGVCCIVAGSDSGNVALIGPDGALRWRADLGSEVTGLCATSDGHGVAAATGEGDFVVMDVQGHVVAAQRLRDPVTALLLHAQGWVAGTAEGRVLHIVVP